MPGIYKKDPTAEFPRFVCPDSSGVLTRFVGHVRQINRAGLTAGERGLLAAAFGGFVANFASGGATAAIVDRLSTEAPPRNLMSKTPRRYAGDDTLPGGRYSTVGLNADGDDGGTLSREMRFYTNPAAASAHIDIYDPVRPDAREMLHQKGLGTGDGRRLYLLVSPFEQDAVRDAPASFWTGVDVEVREVAVDGVLDLRRPAAADWLARTITRLEVEVADGERVRCFPYRPDVHSFSDMLPAIADQAKGGGNLHTIIGLFLRQLGVSGLVFPSVRGDFYADCRDASPIRFAGWTFVDYRDAPPPSVSVFFELRPDWPASLVIEGGDDGGRHPAAFADNVKFVVTNEYGGDNGGLGAFGLEQRHDAVFHINAVEALLRWRLQDAGSAAIQSLLEFFAGLSAEDAAQGAKMALYAALGMRDAQRDLAAALDGPLAGIAAAAALRACLGPPPHQGVTGTEFLKRWLQGASSDV
jgi:hypothetical protein